MSFTYSEARDILQKRIDGASAVMRDAFQEGDTDAWTAARNRREMYHDILSDMRDGRSSPTEAMRHLSRYLQGKELA